MLFRICRLALGFSTLLSGSLAAADDPALADYQRLQQWRCAAAPAAVPAGGITWSRDTAAWTLESGEVRLLEPTADGRVTGLVFRGRGRFRMTVPDPVERAQLGRFARKPGLEALDEPFTEMVLRTTGPLPADFAPASAYGPCKLAEERHRDWLESRGYDADARVIAGLLTPGDEYLRADMDTASFGWLTYQFDGAVREEISVERSSSRQGPSFEEVWLSLDRPEDRGADGRPSAVRRPVLDLKHADVAADLTRPGRDAKQGLSRTNQVDGRFRVTLDLVPLVSGPRALHLYLHAEAEVTAVAEEGKPLAFLRDHVGARSAHINDWLWNYGLVVLLDRPLAAGEPRRLTFEYDLNMVNYVSGRSWYPFWEESLIDPHTARLALTVPEKHEVRAVGELRETRVENGLETTVWAADRPAIMVAFSFAERFHEETVKVDGAPEVVAFGSPRSSNKRQIKSVAEDVAASLRWFQELFADPLPVDRFLVTSIVAGHGQAFDGFVHMSEGSYYLEQAGATEKFRGHEVAHQWWGHRVPFATYRDQWLTEAFAEYSAMMLVEATVEGGAKHFAEILDVYAAVLQGSLRGSMSRFARTWLLELNRAERARVGPISLGYRASTAEVPTGYQLQSYVRGAMVLHMLRTLLRDATGGGDGDEAFVAVLRDFIRTAGGKPATTADFAAALARTVPGDWSWFFSQWIDGTAMPTYLWSHQVRPGSGGGVELALSVRQKDVPEGFRMPVPVEVELPGGEVRRLVVQVAQPEETFTFELPARPARVAFDPGHAVLANVRKE